MGGPGSAYAKWSGLRNQISDGRPVLGRWCWNSEAAHSDYLTFNSRVDCSGSLLSVLRDNPPLANQPISIYPVICQTFARVIVQLSRNLIQIWFFAFLSLLH